MTDRSTATAHRRIRLPRDARRTQLLGAALDVFVENGYHAAAMDEIAERAGVSKPVLYQHFPGKLDLYLALLDASCEEAVDAMRTALAGTEDNKERVAATMAAFYAYVDDEKGAFRLVFESDLTNEPAVRERLDRVTTESAALITALIREDTGLPDAQAELLAVSLVGMAQVGARFWLAGDIAVPRDEAVELVSALAWRGISGYPRTETLESTEG